MYTSSTITLRSPNISLSLQDYFANLLVEQIKQQSPDQSPKHVLQGVLANLQSLYQHNQLIFQVPLPTRVFLRPAFTTFDMKKLLERGLVKVQCRAPSGCSGNYCACTHAKQASAHYMAHQPAQTFSCCTHLLLLFFDVLRNNRGQQTGCNASKSTKSCRLLTIDHQRNSRV